MSNCRDKEIQLACFTPNDGSDSVTINHTIVYDNDGIPIATYFSDRTGVVIDEDTYLGGGKAELGECTNPEVECVESQEWTYGIDNTGTSFSEDNTIRITLSDGTSFEFNQPPTTNWTPQMQIWGDEIQQAADDAGIKWFVETRYRNPNNPADLSGGGGFAGPPSVVVSNALTSMVARYVNIQICPGQPVPVDAEIIASSNPARVGVKLTTNGAVKGPLQRFFVCRGCGEEDVWYLDDGVTLADAGQIPDCFEPCGVLSQLPSPPENDCTFEIDVACDSNNSTNTADFTNTITRRATVCNGEQIAVDYFQADPADPNALISYELVGEFVDCASGEPIELPEQPCSNFELTTLYRLNVDDVEAGLLNREWHDTAPVSALISDPVVATEIGRDFRLNHDFSLPVTNTNIQNSLALNDTNNTASELDIQVIEGYIEVTESALFKYSNSSEGYWAVELGECCGELKLLAESGGFSNGREMLFDLPKGIHRIRLWNIDSGGSNSAANLSYSFDNGVTFIVDNTPPNINMFTTKPTEDCLSVRVCEDNLAIIDILTEEVLDPETLTACPRLCEPCCSSSNTGSSDSFDGNVTDVTNNPDQTHVLVSGTGNVPAGLKTVTINSLSGVNTLDNGFQLGNGRRADSISFDATELNRARGLLPAITISGGTWQWVGLEPINEV